MVNLQSRVSRQSESLRSKEELAFKDPSALEGNDIDFEGRAVVDSNPSLSSSEEYDSKNWKKKDTSSDTMLQNIRKKEMYLKEKEIDVSKREEVLKETMREFEMKNEPRKWFRIDIETDIPAEYKRLTKRALQLFSVTAAGLFVNSVTLILVAAMSNGVVIQPMNNVVFSFFALSFGMVGAWVLFKLLYENLIQSNKIRWAAFWAIYTFHCFYVFYSIVGLPNWATSGIFNLITQLGPGGSWVVVGFDVLNIALWISIGFLTAFVGRRVYSKAPAESSSSGGFVSNALFGSLSLDV